jgi:AcrR family transcriptional regulator
MAAVEAVVRDAGLEGATVRAIAARAGVSVGTVYRRFANKRALILAVQRRFVACRSAGVVAALRLKRSHGGSAKRALARFINGAVLAVERDRALLRAFASESSSDAEIHRTITGLIDHLAGGPLDAALAVDVMLMVLRAQVLDGALPSGTAPPRSALSAYLPTLVTTSMGRIGPRVGYRPAAYPPATPPTTMARPAHPRGSRP